MASREEGGFGPTFRQRKGRGRTLTDHVKIFEGIFPNKHHGHHMLKRMHAYTHTCKFMCLNHLRVCLVGRLVDWLSDRLLWLIVCLFVLLFVYLLVVGWLLVCWFVVLLLRPIVRLFVCSVMSLLILFLYVCQCPTPDGATLDIPSICWPGGHLQAASTLQTTCFCRTWATVIVATRPLSVCVCVWVDLFIGVFVRLMCWHCSRIYLFAFERATLCRLFVCMCMGAS